MSIIETGQNHREIWKRAASKVILRRPLFIYTLCGNWGILRLMTTTVPSAIINAFIKHNSGMTLANKCSLFFLLFAITAFNSFAQDFPYPRSKKDTTIPMSALFHFKQDIYYLKEKIKLQQYEIRVLKEVGKIDSLRFGNDSIVTLYTSKAGMPLLRITEKHKNPQNNFEDSIVVFYNKNGLVEYSEMWQPIGKKKERDMKLTCRRYEYDDQNRVIRYVANFPTPRTLEVIYTYDSSGNVTKNSRTDLDFWDERKKTSAK